MNEYTISRSNQIQRANYLNLIFTFVYLLNFISYTAHGVNERALIYLFVKTGSLGDIVLFAFLMIQLLRRIQIIRIKVSYYSGIWMLFGVSLLISAVFVPSKLMYVAVYVCSLFCYYYVLADITALKTFFRIPIYFSFYVVLDSLLNGSMTFYANKGVFINTNGFGQILSLAMACLFSMALLQGRGLSLLEKSLLIVYLALMISTMSRTALFSVLVTSIFYLYLGRRFVIKRKKLNGQTIIVIFAVGIALVAIFFIPWVRTIVFELVSPMLRKIESASSSGQTLSGRNEIWQNIWDARTLFGTREADTQLGSHSTYFAILRNFGLFGLLCYIVLLVASFWNLLKSLKHEFRNGSMAKMNVLSAAFLISTYIAIYGLAEDLSSILNFQMLCMLVCFAKCNRYKEHGSFKVDML
jgi:O-antigen ligase